MAEIDEKYLKPENYVNREMSWLEFDFRILGEARDKSIPLFERLIGLKKKGMTIIFISHKLKEVKQISDRITVLKSGHTEGTYRIDEVTEEDIS